MELVSRFPKSVGRALLVVALLVGCIGGAGAQNARPFVTKWSAKKKNEVINVNNEIKSLIRVFDKKHEIHFQADRENILINFDKVFFQRIMTNLILNAQQAEDEDRKLSINIALELLNKKISITVEDNGVGIPKEKLEKIFEPNFTTKTSGTGLGLTMVKRMIEDYKGEISIRSQEKRGTKVFVILPVNM